VRTLLLCLLSLFLSIPSTSQSLHRPLRRGKDREDAAPGGPAGLERGDCDHGLVSLMACMPAIAPERPRIRCGLHPCIACHLSGARCSADRCNRWPSRRRPPAQTLPRSLPASPSSPGPTQGLPHWHAAHAVQDECLAAKRPLLRRAGLSRRCAGRQGRLAVLDLAQGEGERDACPHGSSVCSICASWSLPCKNSYPAALPSVAVEIVMSCYIEIPLIWHAGYLHRSRASR
jgi:hypothetical protein